MSVKDDRGARPCRSGKMETKKLPSLLEKKKKKKRDDTCLSQSVIASLASGLFFNPICVMRICDFI